MKFSPDFLRAPMKRFLHVDPDSAFCMELTQALQSDKFKSARVAAFEDAARLLESEDFFCVVVDTATSDRFWPEGISVLRKVRHNLPVILTTGENVAQTERRARLENVTFYYVKGFEKDELLEAIRDTFKLERKGRDMAEPQKRILVIDDDPDFQEALRMILINAGYDVSHAYSKKEGTELLAKVAPDLVVLDIMMETASAGFHFLYETLGPGGKQKPHIPVLAVTSISRKTGFRFSPEADEDFFPADDCLQKPVKPEELLDRIAKLLGQQDTGGLTSAAQQ